MARQGILGTKLGMTQVFDENNKVVPVTVVKAGPNVVTRIRTPERDGYSAVQLAYGEISPRKVTKPVTGQFAAAGINPRRHLAELRAPALGDHGRGHVVLAGAGLVVGRLPVDAGAAVGFGLADRLHHVVLRGWGLAPDFGGAAGTPVDPRRVGEDERRRPECHHQDDATERS